LAHAEVLTVFFGSHEFREKLASAGFIDFPAAPTKRDADGHYLPCGLPAGESVELGSGPGGYATFVSIPPGQTTDAEIEIK
jgi:hypothetical protein